MSKYVKFECPECGHKEAFVYLSKLEEALKYGAKEVFAQCSRKNNCSFNGKINIEAIAGGEYSSTEVVQRKKKEEDIEKKISLLGIEAINFLSELKVEYPKGDIRGISPKTLNKTPFTYLEKEWLPWINASEKLVIEENRWIRFDAERDFGPFYKKETFKGRNLLFWITDYKGRVRRVLMRSDNKKVFPKEMQMVIPGDDANQYNLWNVMQAINSTNLKAILLVEGVYDALSIMETIGHRDDVVVISIAGVGTYRNILQLTEEINKKRSDAVKVYVGFDADTAGEKYAKELMELYENTIRVKPQGTYKKMTENGEVDVEMDFNDMFNNSKEELRGYLLNMIPELN